MKTRRFVSEQNFLLALSLIISVSLWYYVTASRTPRVEPTMVKTVAVVPAITGEPAYGYNLLGVRVTPQVIIVSGDPEQLAQVQRLTTEAVSISGATRDVVREVGVLAPAGLNVSGRVQVAVQIVPAVVVTVVGIRVQVLNTPPGLVAEVQPEMVQVQVQGPITLVSRLRPNDFSARIDGLDFAEGRHRVPVELQAPPHIEVLSVTPSVVVVTVRKGG